MEILPLFVFTLIQPRKDVNVKYEFLSFSSKTKQQVNKRTNFMISRRQTRLIGDNTLLADEHRRGEWSLLSFCFHVKRRVD